MKIKITITTLSTIIALAMITMNAFSQNINFSPPQTMGATINSVSNESNAVISPNGLSLYFQSNRAGNADIYVSQRASLSSPWGAPQNLGATVNTAATESIGSLSLDGKTMFLQSNRAGGVGLRDNYISTRTDPNNDFGWTTPVNPGPIVNSASDDLAAVYFEDPATGAGSIIFSSDRVGTPGMSFHLYQSTRNTDGTFNAPTPISELNVIGAETHVAIRRDGLQIFISATLPPPGTFDIYVSTRASTTSSWSAPTLVPGINSETLDGSPSLSPDGLILYFHSARAGGSGGNDLYSVTQCSVYTTTLCVNRTQAADFDGDGRTDLSVFRPSDGTWHVLNSGNNTHRVQTFGVNGDKTVSGDYDGDGRMDLAVFRPSDPAWWILNSSNNTFSVTQFGLATDKLTPGDYDGDGRTDIAIYRNGTWWIRQSSNGQDSVRQFGALSGDIPVAGGNAQ